ncbi:MAG TPA: hypothetical protein VGL95_10230 [Acetobacteraceae bacterium]
MLRSMISTPLRFPRRSISTAALVAALIGCFAATSPASARVWIGFGFPGIYVGPPAYYAPPPYYYPPPAYYPPPTTSYAPSYASPPASTAPTEAAGQSCNAGAYVCPMDQPVASGAACYCLGAGGTHVWGHAN